MTYNCVRLQLFNVTRLCWKSWGRSMWLAPNDSLLRYFTRLWAKAYHVLHSLINTPMSAFLG